MKALERTVRVVPLSEWNSGTLEGAVLSPKGRLLATSLASEGRLYVDELRSGLRITTTSWVGLVRFDDFEVRITPKLAGENIGLVRMIEFATGISAFKRIRSLQKVSQGVNLLDLVVLLFAEACEALIRQGLQYDYVDRQGDLPHIRGRLMVDRQVLRRYGRVDRVECRYDEHESDIVENQVLTAAIGLVVSRVKDEGVKIRLRRLRTVFEGACAAYTGSITEARSVIVYNRLNEHYREAHELAWLIFEGLGVDELFQSQGSRCFAFLINMNNLFELFVSRWIKRLLRPTALGVRCQAKHRSIIWNATQNRSYASAIPDLLVEGGDVGSNRVAIDAKYKLYGERKLAPSDVYQLFLYAYAFGRHNEQAIPKAILVYPASFDALKEQQLEIRNVQGASGALIHALGLHIPSAIEEANAGFKGPISRGFLNAV